MIVKGEKLCLDTCIQPTEIDVRLPITSPLKHQCIINSQNSG